jgi:hypothetical protein
MPSFVPRQQRQKIVLMTLRKGANSLGLQVQSVVVRVNFTHEGTRGLISNSRGTVEKAPVVLFKQPAKQLPCLISPTLPSGCQAQGVNVSKMKYDDTIM